MRKNHQVALFPFDDFPQRMLATSHDEPGRHGHPVGEHDLGHPIENPCSILLNRGYGEPNVRDPGRPLPREGDGHLRHINEDDGGVEERRQIRGEARYLLGGGLMVAYRYDYLVDYIPKVPRRVKARPKLFMSYRKMLPFRSRDGFTGNLTRIRAPSTCA
jgi:hypothetical protein